MVDLGAFTEFDDAGSQPNTTAAGYEEETDPADSESSEIRKPWCSCKFFWHLIGSGVR